MNTLSKFHAHIFMCLQDIRMDQRKKIENGRKMFTKVKKLITTELLVILCNFG